MAEQNLRPHKTLLFDMELAETACGVRLRMHEPVRRGVVLECNAPWEGEHTGYGKMIFDGEKYRYYYRGGGANGGPWKEGTGEHGVWCVAYSRDGKHFEKPDLGLYEFEGSTHNNIVMQLDDKAIDNFSIMLDTNPACPADAKYKAISGYRHDGKKHLGYYKSADGLSFTYVEDIPVEGRFDSMNIVFWDERIGKYRLYFRDYHTLDRTNRIEYEAEEHVRDIKLSLSEDFVHWSEPVLLDYGEDDRLELQLYTNGIMPYPDSDFYVGIPTRYIDRTPDAINYKYLPDLGGFRPFITEHFGRCGTAMTEAILMVSRDGHHFKRTKEAFLTAGIENGENWAYGDGYMTYGMIETVSDFPGEPNELSLYVGKGYRARPVSFERYTLRMDGFYSWRADFEGGEVITKPIVLAENGLTVNFATSALGYLRIELLGLDGKPLEGYDTGRLFGNSPSRPCDFEKPLADLAGKAVRMRITMKDCDFYSFTSY